jgi:class 3 adenylate cyclase
MTGKTEKLAILFADISGSTTLYEEKGNVRAREMVSNCLAVMIAEVNRESGTVVKTIGDELMCTFPEAVNACRAAREMQVAVETRRPKEDGPMYIRIGFHYGEVIPEGKDVHGDAVNVAARITEVSRARQIIATQEVVDALPHELRARARQIRSVTIKGKQEQLDIFQIGWQDDDEDATRIIAPSFGKPQEKKPEQLVLDHEGQRFTVGDENRSAMLGRGEGCSIRVKDDFSSRQHARVDFRFGKFLIADQSINGTYVRFADGETVHIVREEALLRSTGEISLGRPFTEAAAKPIKFLIPG